MSQSPEAKQAILFLAANPDGLRQVGKELREIKEGLRRSQERDRFSLTPCLIVRPRDIQRACWMIHRISSILLVGEWVQRGWSLKMRQAIQRL
jgi:hypothetical protein